MIAFTICHACGTKEMCEECQVCHACGAPIGSATPKWATGSTLPASTPHYIDPAKAKSQKIIGLVKLKNFLGVGSTLGINRVFPVGALEAPKEEVLAQMAPALPAFVRPCPITPKHGFVDSRVVKTPEEAYKVLEETAAADPEGELMFTNCYKEVTLNTIFTPTLLTVGKGNDGATAGKNTILFPLTKGPNFTKVQLEAAKIGPNEDPYIEGIRADSMWINTQLRAGPKLESGNPDYIPFTVQVHKVIQTAGEDLLTWAKIMEVTKSGTVVYHPGGSPTDHFFVHARLWNVPVFTTKKPEVGVVYLANTGSKVPLDPQAALDGFVAAATVPIRTSDGSAGSATNFLIAALHNSGAFQGKDAQWIGAAVGFMLRLGSIALRGEARHRHSHKSAKKIETRAAVYDKCFGKPLSYHAAALNRHAQVFRFGLWPSSGFGGKKWAECAYSLEPLYQGIQALVQDPTELKLKKLIGHLNIALHQAHNGGWWLNKFTDSNAPNTIPQGQLGILYTIVPTIVKVRDAIEAKGFDSVREKVLTRWQTMPLVQIKTPYVSKASFKENMLMLTMPTVHHAAMPFNVPLKQGVNLSDLCVAPDGRGGFVLNATGQEKPLWSSAPLNLDTKMKGAEV